MSKPEFTPGSGSLMVSEVAPAWKLSQPYTSKARMLTVIEKNNRELKKFLGIFKDIRINGLA